MKRVVYSNITKTVAFLICLAAVFTAVCVVGEFAAGHMDDYGNIAYLNDLEREAAMPAIDIFASVNSYCYDTFDSENTADDYYEDSSDSETAESPEDREAQLRQNIGITESYYPEGAVDYYIEIGDVKLDTGKELDDYKNSKYRYIYYSTPSEVYLDNPINCGVIPTDENMKVYIAVSDEYAESIESAVTEWRTSFNDIIGNIVFLFMMGLAAFVYLLFVCGRKYGDTEIHMALIDRMFVEITLLLIAGITIGFTLLAAMMILDTMPSTGTGMIFAAACVETCAAAAVIALSMSAVRNMKNRTFLKRSIICRAVLFVWRGIKTVWRWIKRLAVRVKDSIKRLTSERMSMAAAAALIVYTVIVLIFGPVGALIAFLAACVVLAVRFGDLDTIKKGVGEIKGGNLSYKIDTLKSPDYADLANDINEIGVGLAASVEEKVRAERMKTELITNVSHDLKTPLTSIINYTKLLTEMDLKPEEAADYVKIIEKKSNRLKNLTADLFDISKIQSGNEEIKLERLDAGLLISQTLGEQDREIKESCLEFIVKTGDDIFITADGRKMSRVMNNLVNNIVKYALRGTRVYINAEKQGDKAVIELKNIASYKMDFDDGEITERFVRGDKSRSEEGNGLGLAIAKSYTEACGGNFRVKTDGDLFKVILEFKAVE